MYHRVIPRLDIKGPNLVKGIHMEGLRVLGKPEDYAKRYYEDGADELIYVDTVASLYKRNSLLDIIEKASSEIFIPLTVGGGLRTIEDIRDALSAGADKVAINTKAINDPSFIKEAARRFGSSTIVIDVQVVQNTNNEYECLANYGRERTGKNPIDWAREAESLGAGEILLTSVNREGTGRGFDIELTEAVSSEVKIPVIASGGAGKADDVQKVINDGRADAVCLASLLHYHYVKQFSYEPKDFRSEGNFEFLKGTYDFSIVRDISIPDLKKNIIQAEINTRPSNGHIS